MTDPDAQDPEGLRRQLKVSEEFLKKLREKIEQSKANEFGPSAAMYAAVAIATVAIAELFEETAERARAAEERLRELKKAKLDLSGASGTDGVSFCPRCGDLDGSQIPPNHPPQASRANAATVTG